MSYLKPNEKLKECIPIVSIASVTLFLAAYVKPNAEAKSNTVTAKTKWIMIGDSYSTRPRSDKSKTWPYLLKKRLGGSFLMCF